jgi:protease-4
MDVAAGGAHLATAADVILAHPTTVTGGIGVIWNSYNLKDMMLQQNIFHQPIKAGTNIDMGTMTTPLPPEAKRLLQEMADEFHERFKRVVLKARPSVDPNRAATFDGRVHGDAAQQLGLVGLPSVTSTTRSPQPAPPPVRPRAGSSSSIAPETLPSRPTQARPTSPSRLWRRAGQYPGMERSRLPTFLYLWQPDRPGEAGRKMMLGTDEVHVWYADPTRSRTRPSWSGAMRFCPPRSRPVMRASSWTGRGTNT